MNKIKILEYAASIPAIIGSVWLSQNIPSSSFGWLLFLVSSLLWIIFALKTRMHALLVQSIVFTMSNVSGIWNWVIPYINGS